jgi:hypothetical protein
MKSFFEALNESSRDKEMIDGVVRLLCMVRDEKNRKEMVDYMLKDFEKENIRVDKQNFMKRCNL